MKILHTHFLLSRPGLLVTMLGVLSPLLPTYASSPADQRMCTEKPQALWLSESTVREQFGPQDFASFKFKISKKTHCYEYYGVRKDGVLVEAYYDPMTGDAVKRTEITPGGTTRVFEPRVTPTPSSVLKR